MKNKLAFTLIELLVYMAIMGFVIVVAGRAFSDSTSMRVRSQSMIKSAEVTGKISELLREDISQMGTKAWGQVIGTGSGYEVQVVNEVYNNIGMGANPVINDSSSFILTRAGNFDSLTFRKAAFNDTGAFLCVREVRWYATGTGEFRDLHRACRSLACNPAINAAGDPDRTVCPVAATPTAVLIANNVRRFTLTPSQPVDSRDTLFPPAGNPNFSLQSRGTQGAASGAVPLSGLGSNNATNIALTGFVKNPINTPPNQARFNEIYLSAPNAAGWGNCASMQLFPGETYSVEFRMPWFQTGDTKNDSLSTQFQPGVDHISIGLRNPSNGAAIPGASADALVYPPQSELAANRPIHAEFTVRQPTNACVALTFAFYSLKAGGKIRFADFKVLRNNNTGSFRFLKQDEPGFDPDYGVGNQTTPAKRTERRNVRAFQVLLEVEHNGERVGTYSGDGTGMVIVTPNNGVVAQSSNP
jgi:type II secretory pathway pseudopilin PulG